MSFRPSRIAPPGPRRPIAPIHRGPQAVSQSVSGTHQVTQQIHHAPNAALLIDFDNVTMGIRSDLQTELKNLLASDIIKGKVSVQRAYADWRRYPQYIVPLAESSIDMIMAPAYGSAKKNATDIRLAIDALELVFVRPEIGTFILLSGDSDFSSLVIKLKEYGKYVIGVGIRESSSDLLVMNCDEYYSYTALAGLVRSGEEEVVKHDPWELVSEAVQRMKRNGDVMRADRLKQVMQQIDSSFDEKNVGKAKFSLFVSEAAKRGLLTVTKLENGQLEVDVPRAGSSGLPAGQGTPAAPAASGVAAAAPAAEEGDDQDRARRGRRGGRGRGREDRGSRETKPDAAAAPAAPQETVAAAEPKLRTAAPAPQPAARRAAPAVAADGIGASGLRLTRDEAFDLVRRAVASAATGDKVAPAAKVRSAARSLLGRDSESLSERNFLRILHDAHDADVVDLRRRGADYEVAASVAAPTVELQLEAAATANAPAPKPFVPAPRGMGARGSGRGLMGAKAGPPANLLDVGVVGPRVVAPSAPAPTAAPTNTAKPAADAEAVAIVEEASTPSTAKTGRPVRKRAGAAKKAAAAKQPSAKATAGHTKTSGEAAAPVKRARTARKKTAAKSAAGSSDT
ncbi:MAG: NYN domain-containing protein [Gemmatimonadaceae bacterium]|nr:NYN domain-containing protein [Gemmatimonadaceae bacterium]